MSEVMNEEMLEEHKELVRKIVECEWDMLGKVDGIGGIAPCQENEDTFTIMRSSQFMAWPNQLIRSYMLDFQGAYLNHRNIVAEKYAHMMKYSDAENYKALSHQLPTIPQEQLDLIELIVAKQMSQMTALLQKYPKFIASGRALQAKDDVPDNASYETYLRGELSSYGLKTVKLYLKWLEDNENDGIITAKLFMENVALQYGYPDLQSAEEALTHPQ